MSSTVRTHPGSEVRHQAAALLFYAVVSVAISWPLAAHFTSSLTGHGLDALSHLWGVWHAVLAMSGREPLFSTDLLYYPAGASLLLHSAGPLTGVLALPLWPLGPIAGYNGGLLVGLTLTGYAMYLLARDLDCSRPAALVAGIVLLTAPVHLVGLRGHLAQVFLGLLPIACLTLRRALDRRRSPWWLAVFALSVVLLLLQSPLQFVQVALVGPLFVVAALGPRDDRPAILRRAFLAAAVAAAAAAPLLIATARAAADPAMSIDRSAESAAHQPDLSQFVLPPSFSTFFGQQTTALLARWQVAPEIETEVSVPLVAWFLAGAALFWQPRASGVWIAIAVAAAALSLGPTLTAFGRTWPIGPALMPYSWIAALPGLDFLRTPPRFMQVGFVGISAAVALGLTRASHTPSIGRVLAALASLLLLIEVWPLAWPTEEVPPPSAFHQRIAADAERYGLLDLPVRPLPEVSPQDYSAHYQVLQLLHRKGIFGGYLSRVYAQHPISPCVFADDRAPRDVRVNGAASRCEPAAIHQLATHGYRYVVWHQPSAQTPENLPASWAAEDAQAFVTAAFGKRPPDIVEPLVHVWRIPRASEALPLIPVVELETGWYPAEPEWRWAASPATITITAPRSEEAELSVSMRLVHDRTTSRGLGPDGVLIVTSGPQSVSRAFRIGDIVRVPLTLSAGAQTVSIALGAGNFRPTEYGESDPRPLAFAINWLELTTK